MHHVHVLEGRPPLQRVQPHQVRHQVLCECRLNHRLWGGAAQIQDVVEGEDVEHGGEGEENNEEEGEQGGDNHGHGPGMGAAGGPMPR